MLANILKWLGLVIAAVGCVVVVIFLFRTDPIGVLAGKRLSGVQLPYPNDWRSCSAHPTVAIEVAPDAPHSVTTLCFVHQGELIIPAANASNKTWPSIVLKDPRVRIKIGEVVYPAHAYRASDLTFADIQEDAAKKYPRFAQRDVSAPLPGDVWLFKIAPRENLAE